MSIFYVHLTFADNSELWLEDYQLGNEKVVIKNHVATSVIQHYFVLNENDIKRFCSEEIEQIEIRYENQPGEMLVKMN